MNPEMSRSVVKFEKQHSADFQSAAPSREFEINTVFTNPDGTIAALKMAAGLGCNLGARVRVVAPQVVPLGFPLSRPPVSIRFTEQRLLEIVQRGVQGDLNTAVRVYLCRDQQQVLRQVLKPKSLVIIGGKKRWWPRKADWPGCFGLRATR